MANEFIQRLQPQEQVEYPKTRLGLKWQQLQAADLAELITLIRYCEVADKSLHSVSEQRLSLFLEYNLGVLPAEALVGRDTTGKIQAFAAVEIQIPDVDLVRAEVVAFISPEFRGRGIGRAVLKWQEQRARQLFVSVVEPDAQLEARLANLVDAHMNDRRRLYMAAGFSPKRTFDVMYYSFTTEQVTAVSPRNNYVIEPWTVVAETTLQQMHDRAFADHWGTLEETRSWWTLARPALEPRWSYAAFSSTGELAGYIMVCKHPARWVAAQRSEAYIELLGVSPEARDYGVGKALLTHAMAAVQASHINAIGLDVDCDNSHGAREFYKRMGFVSVGEQVYYALDL